MASGSDFDSTCHSRLTTILHTSPKPGLPPPKAYDPPSPPATRDLGPPPPGYGRYADFDRNYQASGGTLTGANTSVQGTFIKRNYDDVLCFKVKHLSDTYS